MGQVCATVELVSYVYTTDSQKDKDDLWGRYLFISCTTFFYAGCVQLFLQQTKMSEGYWSTYRYRLTVQ